MDEYWMNDQFFEDWEHDIVSKQSSTHKRFKITFWSTCCGYMHDTDDTVIFEAPDADTAWNDFLRYRAEPDCSYYMESIEEMKEGQES